MRLCSPDCDLVDSISVRCMQSVFSVFIFCCWRDFRGIFILGRRRFWDCSARRRDAGEFGDFGPGEQRRYFKPFRIRSLRFASRIGFVSEIGFGNATMREAERRWTSFGLAVFLLFHCIALCRANCPADGLKYAVTNSKTTLLKEYGPGGSVITTLEYNVCIQPICRVLDKNGYVEDDPFWLYASVPSLGISGWVADYYADCGYVGYCLARTC